MLYDEYAIHGNYLAHHGVKGMRWGVRRFKDSHLYRTNREAYRKRITDDKIKSKDKRASFIKERNDIIRSHVKSAGKTALASTGAGVLAGIGAAALGAVIGGPAGAAIMHATANGAIAAFTAAGTMQTVAMWANTIDKSLTLSEIYKK